MKRSSLQKRLVRLFLECGITLATAESCTGGLIAKLITDVPGSSAVLLGGVVSYTNEVKIGMLGVSPETIARDTEVSHSCAKEMAMGVRDRLGSDFAVATTGFAGPGGGTEQDPVGTVYLAVASQKGVWSERFEAPHGSTRTEVRNAAARRAMELLMQAAEA